jgi:hypothetical protein
MKVRTIVPAIAILLISSFPLEAKKNIRPFFLRITATMNGVEIPSGIYDVSWESEKAGVRVTFWKNGQFFATAKGEWAKHGQKYTDDAAVLRVNPDGSRSLVEIRIAGDKKTIVLRSVEPTVQLGSK